MIGVEVIVLLACISAGLGRALLPYIRKLKEAEETGSTIEFQRKYLFTTLYSVGISLIFGLLAYPAIIQGTPDTGALVGVFITAFGTAWGLNDLFNQIIATGSGSSSPVTLKKKEEEPKPLT